MRLLGIECVDGLLRIGDVGVRVGMRRVRCRER
jgi:hypothetical protein